MPEQRSTSLSIQADAKTRSVSLAVYAVLAFFLVAASATVVAIFSRSPTSNVRTTDTVSRRNLEIKVKGIGTLESSRNTEIKCQIRGGYGGRGGRSTVTWVIPAGSIVKKGDELVRLDSKVIEETVSLGKTDTNIAKAALAQAEANVAKAKISIASYLEGRFRSQMQTLENQKRIAVRNLDRAKAMLTSSEALYARGFVTKLDVESGKFSVKQAKLELDVKETEIDVLSRLTKTMEIRSLEGQLVASTARLEGRKAGLALEQGKLQLAEQELQRCTIRAPQDGLVIFPSTARWKNAPDVSAGASVHNNQVLLLMPDLSSMQVKVGVHESLIDQVRPGMKVKVSLPDRELESEVASVANVANPVGWWNGNQVQYDVTILLPSQESLNPGKTADIEILAARHEDVLTIPVSALVETAGNHYCWIETSQGIECRTLTIGESDDEFVIALSGLEVGDTVIENPLVSLEEARQLIEPSLLHTIERGHMQITLTEQGTLESANNTKIKCKVRGASTINWVIENGTYVQAGDELVRIENKQIEEYLHERTKFAHLSRDSAIGYRTQADRAEVAISQYLEGQFHTQLLTYQKDIAILQGNLSSARNALDHAKMMAKDEYVPQIELEEKQFAVKQTELTLEAKREEVSVLQEFTKKEELARLQGNWEAAKAAAEGHEEVLRMDEQRVELAQQEMERCIIRADRSGLVVYPKSDHWKDAPDIAQGSTVHNDQVLLLMPDLSKMQVRVGIHESMLKSIRPGMHARVVIPNETLDGKVTSIASVARPVGLWSGNVVKYDAIIELPSSERLKPGMNAEVHIQLEEFKDALRIPACAVFEGEDGPYCWLGPPANPTKRMLNLGPGSDEYLTIQSGLRHGEQVLFRSPSE